MITVLFDDEQFNKDMRNIMNYSEGFVEGIESGKGLFLKEIADTSSKIFEEFVDQQARIDPQMYHHIYEWYQEGNPIARLFNIEHTQKKNEIIFNGVFKQSTSIKIGSNVPFYNKAEIMENGITVTIAPKNSDVLAFNIGNETIFVSRPETIDNPGGNRVQHAFQNIFRLFFEQHFTESVLKMTGISKYLSNAKVFNDNFRNAKNFGKEKGLEIGYNWIVKAGILNV